MQRLILIIFFGSFSFQYIAAAVYTNSSSKQIKTTDNESKKSFHKILKDTLEIMAQNLERQLVVDRSGFPVYNVVNDLHFDNTGFVLITDKFQHAIDSLTKNGPARFLFPRGAYLTGSIILKSGVHLEFEDGSKIIGSTNPDDYIVIKTAYKNNTDSQVDKSLFYAEKADGISFTGKGVIDFQGDHPQYFYTHNNDGIDIDGCRNVYVRNCRFDSDDDAICLKSNGPSRCENVLIENCIASSHYNALKLGTETTGGFRNIIYRNCKVIPSVTGNHQVNGLEKTQSAITLIITDGGKMENIWFDNIDAENAVTPIFITLGNRSRTHTDDVPKPGVGSIENVRISDFSAKEAGPKTSSATGLNNDFRLKNITLKDIKIELEVPGNEEDRNLDITAYLPTVKGGYPSSHSWKNLPSSAFYFKYIDGLTLKNISVKTKCVDPREAIIKTDCTKVQTENIEMNKKAYKIK